MNNTKKLLANPHDVDLSIIVPTIHFDLFQSLYNCLVKTCSSPEQVEILLKLDDATDFDKFYNLCDSGVFKYKILMYSQYNSRYSLHHFYNDLGALTSGKMIWILNDDVIIKQGDWYHSLIQTRGSFKDNIYCVIVPFDKAERKRGMVPTPAFSREWYNLFGYVSKFPNYDRWLGELSKSIDRRVFLTKEQLLVTMPKGRRVMSKKERKELFNPSLNKVIKRTRRKLKC